MSKLSLKHNASSEVYSYFNSLNAYRESQEPSHTGAQSLSRHKIRREQ